MHALLEAPALRRPHVRVLVVAVVLDLVGVPAEADHEHVDDAGCALRRRRDDVIRIDVPHTLLDPRHVLAAVRSPARDRLRAARDPESAIPACR